MTVSISTSHTSATRRTLSDALYNSANLGIKMSTGESIIHAYENPTGLAISTAMKGALDITRIVLIGVIQTKSMLNIAEEGIKAMSKILGQINEVLAKSQLGYMTDELIEDTLAPMYQQLKDELKRIPDAIEFNKQKLLNGHGGEKVDAVLSTVSNIPVFSFYNAESSLKGITGLTAFEPKFTAGANGAVTVAYNGAKYKLTEGTYKQVGSDITITNATLKISGITLTDTAVAPASPISGNADLTITGVNIKLTAPTQEFDVGTGKLKDTSPTITLPTTAANYTLSDLSESISNWIPTTHTAATAVQPATGIELTVDSVKRTFELSDGQTAMSKFKFVTGSDLNEAIVSFAMPNLRLTSLDGIPGMIETINTKDNILTSRPTDLSELKSVKDAARDIPLVEAISSEYIKHLDRVGAYQTRLNTIEQQLATAVEQLENARGEIAYVNLAEATEDFTKANMRVSIAIQVLKQMNKSMQSLEQLVQ